MRRNAIYRYLFSVANGLRITKPRRFPGARLTKKPKMNLRIEKGTTRKVTKRGTVGLKFQPIRKPRGQKSRPSSR